jgi:hypothetical protein
LFPGAAAPIVALVRLAREHADRDAVAAALRRWWALPAGEADPWGEYYLMQGGDVVERMQAVYDLAGVCLGKLGPSRPPTIGVIQP